MKTMFWNSHCKSTTLTADTTPWELTQMRSGSRWRPLAFCVLALLGFGAGLGGAGVSNADGLDWDELPSYLAETHSIAALVQDDSTPQAAGDRPNLQLPDDDDSTLRDALETLSEDDGSQVSADPVDQVTNRSLFSDRRTQLVGGRFELPPITALTTGTAEIGNGELPLGFREGAQPPMIALPESGNDRGLPWQWNARTWAAANTFSHPLYFEDRMLERHGHRRYPFYQPVVSGGRFLAQVVALPYLAAIHPPSECQYSLGYYRAGTCVPAFLQRPPYQRKAVAAQATAAAVGFTIWP